MGVELVPTSKAPKNQSIAIRFIANFLSTVHTPAWLQCPHAQNAGNGEQPLTLYLQGKFAVLWPGMELRPFMSTHSPTLHCTTQDLNTLSNTPLHHAMKFWSNPKSLRSQVLLHYKSHFCFLVFYLKAFVGAIHRNIFAFGKAEKHFSFGFANAK